MSRPALLQLEVAERSADRLFVLCDEYRRFLNEHKMLAGYPKALQARAMREFNEVSAAHSAAQALANSLATLNTSFAAIHHTDDQVELANAYTRVAAASQKRLEQGSAVADEYHEAVGETSDLVSEIDSAMATANAGPTGAGVGVNYFSELEAEFELDERSFAESRHPRAQLAPAL